MRARLAAGLGLAGLLALMAPAAHAASVTLTNAVNVSYDGEGGRIVSQDVAVSVKASVAEHNAVTLTASVTEVRVQDDGAPVVAGPGCVQDGPTAARCAVVRSARKTDTYTNNMDVELGDEDDRLTASSLPAARPYTSLTVDAGDGDDDITAPGAIVRGGAGQDRLAAWTADGGAGDDTLEADAAARPAGDASDGSVLIGREGHDVLRGGARDDTLDPGSGDDQVDGGGGRDELRYANREHGMSIDLASVPGTATGTGERDTIAAVEIVVATDHADLIVGGAADEVLDGGRGADRIFGGDGDDTLLAASSKARLHGGAGDDFLLALRPGSDCGTGTDTFAAFDGPLRLGRVRRGCELAEPLLPGQVDDASPLIDVASVRVRRGRLEITFLADGPRSHRIDIELFLRQRRLAYVSNVLLRGGLHRRTSFRVPLTALGRRLFAADAHLKSMLYLDDDVDLLSQIVQIDR